MVTSACIFMKMNLKTNGIVLSNRVIEENENAYKSFKARVKETYGKTIREFWSLNEKFY